MAQKTVLGKGLASLLPGAATPPVLGNVGALLGATDVPAPTVEHIESSRDRHPGISFAPVDEIEVNEYQPRRDFDEKTIEELAQSIRENGVIQPLIVRKTPKGYQLIAGERRLRASKRAGVKQVPIVIRKTTDRESLELALIENIQRQDLNCIDEAMAYFQLMQEFSLTQEEVAKRVGKERASVANHLRLLRLPEAIIDDLKRGILSLGHGKALLSVEDTEIRLQVRAQVVEKSLSVRETEALIQRFKEDLDQNPDAMPSSQAASGGKSMEAVQMENIGRELSNIWSTRVLLKGSGKKGRIVFHYRSSEELERILTAMQNK